LRLSRLGTFDAALSAVRADADADAACKTGDHGRAVRHEHLAASYRAMRDYYRQQAQALTLTMADRQEWEQATAGSRRLAIAADAELRRRHPHQKIEPLRSAEPVSNSEWEQTHPTPGQEISQAQQEVSALRSKADSFWRHPTQIPDGAASTHSSPPGGRPDGPPSSSRPSRPSSLRQESFIVPPNTISNPRPEADRTVS
jgi:hypothetical protein